MADSKPAPRTEPVIRLTTIANTVPIEIDKRIYAMRHPFSLPLARYEVIRQLGVDIDAFEKKARLTDTEEARLSELYAELVSIILIAPDEVKAKLNDLQRAMVFQAFIELRLQMRGNATEAKPKTSPSTGANSSRNSRASTAGRRRTGSSASPTV